MTITLTEAGKTALHGTAGFAADGVTDDANDQIDILAGFSRDLAGNVGADDAAALNLTKDQYTDSTGPTVGMFAAVRVDQTDGTIDGWTAGEITALGAADSAEYTAALSQAQAVFGDEYTTITAGDAKLLDGDFTIAGKIGIMAGLSETILAEGTLTADLNSSSSASVQLTTIADPVDGAEATGDVNSDLLFGVYTVAENENVTGLSIEEFTQSGVKDIYGNTMTTLTVPQTGNIDDNSTINIDAAAPTNTITGASYNPATGVITFTGTNFTTIAATSVEDITSYMDWTKVWWDIDGDNDSTADGAAIGDDDFAFTADKISNTTVVSGTTMTATLTADAKAALHGTAGFAADDVTAGIADLADDQIDVLAGFSRDALENAATLDAAAIDLNKQSYVDSDNPSVVSFAAVDGTWSSGEITALGASDSVEYTAALSQAQAVFGDEYIVISEGDLQLLSGGSFKADDTISLIANLNEGVIKGSTITATFTTTNQVEFSAAASGDSYLTGTLTVSDFLSNELDVSSFSATDINGDATSVKDIYGNAMNNFEVDAGFSLIDTTDIFIDNIPVSTTGATLSLDAEPGAGDELELTFTESVANADDVVSAIVSAADTYGTSPTAEFSNLNKTLTITLGADETVADATELTLADIEDEAGNTSNLTFTVDVS